MSLKIKHSDINFGTVQDFECYTAGVLNLLVRTYPQIRIVMLCVPPNENFIIFAYPPNQ